MIKFCKQPKQTKMIRQPDPEFFIKDGITLVPRAGFEISSGCPKEYRLVLQECIHNGWIKPVAHIRDYELTYDKLFEA